MARLTLNGMYQYDQTLFDGMILPEGYDRDTLFSEIMTRSGMLYPYHQVPAILKANIRLWFSRNYLNFDRTMEALTAEYNPIENYNRYEDWTRTPNLNDTGTTSGSDTMTKTGTEATAASGKDSAQLSGTDTVALSGKDTEQLSGTDTTTRTHTNYHETNTRSGSVTTEKQVSAFDSSAYQPAEKEIQTYTNLEDDKAITGSYADATAYGKKDETTYGKSEGTTYGKKDETTYGRTDTTTYNTSDQTLYGKTLTERHTGKEDYTSHIHGNIGVTTNQQMIEAELELRKFDIYDDIAARFEHEFCVQVY